MQNVILVIHIIACIVMTVVIMLQKSEGGALGIGGGGGGLMTGRSAAGALVRVTMFFGAIFFATSLGLTTLANRTSGSQSAIERALDSENPNGGSGPVDILDPNTPLLENSQSEAVSSDQIAPPLGDVGDQIAPALPEAPESAPVEDGAPDPER